MGGSGVCRLTSPVGARPSARLLFVFRVKPRARQRPKGEGISPRDQTALLPQLFVHAKMLFETVRGCSPRRGACAWRFNLHSWKGRKRRPRPSGNALISYLRLEHFSGQESGVFSGGSEWGRGAVERAVTAVVAYWSFGGNCGSLTYRACERASFRRVGPMEDRNLRCS